MSRSAAENGEMSESFMVPRKWAPCISDARSNILKLDGYLLPVRNGSGATG